MKLHLNLTLRRAVLAAMALVAVHTTQAQDIVIESVGSSTLTGDITWAGIVNFGDSTKKEDCTLQDGTFHATNSIYIGGKGYGANATYGNNGSITVTGNATLTATNSINVGNTQVTQENGDGIVGTLNVDGGTVKAGTDLTIGVNKGTGHVTVTNGGTITANDYLHMGYWKGGAENSLLIDGPGSCITIGEKGGNDDYTSVGYETSAKVQLTNGAAATFHEQTIIGVNAGGKGEIYVLRATDDQLADAPNDFTPEGSTLSLGTKTVLGLNAGAEGFIYVEGSKVTGTEMVIGSAGKGYLSSNGGSTIDLKTLFLGQSKGSEGTLSLEVGDKLTVQTSLTIGNAGDGTFSTKGAEVDVKGNIIIGHTGTGELNAEGKSSIKAKDIVLGSGDDGSGTMNIGAESTVEATNVYIGNEKHSSIATIDLAAAAELKTTNLNIYGKNSKLSTKTGSTTTISTGLTVLGGTLEVDGTVSAANTIASADSSISIGETGSFTNSGMLMSGASIVNDGELINNGIMMTNGLSGKGSVINNEKGIWEVYTQSTTGTITNTGTITILNNGRIDADSLTGTGTTTIRIDKNSLGCSGDVAVIELVNTNTNDIKVAIDMNDSSLLVGKKINFLKVGENLVQLSTAEDDGIFSLIDDKKEWNFDWENSTITTKQVSNTGNGNKQNDYTDFSFKTNTGDTADAVSGITFESLAKHTTYEGTIGGTTKVEVEIVTETKVNDSSNDTEVTVEKAKDENGNDIDLKVEDITSATTVHTATVTGGDSNGKKADINIVFSKEVESTGSSPTVTNTVVSTNTKDQETGAEIESGTVIAATGYTMTFEGTSSHKGKDNAISKAEMGFSEVIENVDGTQQVVNLGNIVIDSIEHKLEEIDVIKIAEGADVTFEDMGVHGTHALIIESGATVTFSNVDAVMGGTQDANILQKVEVPVGDGKETVIVESANHITTQNVISNATLKLLGNTELVFEQINKDVSAENEELDAALHGTTKIEGSTVVLETGNDGAPTLGSSDESAQTIVMDQCVVQMTGGTMENIELNDTVVQGSGKIKDAKIKGKNSYLISGNSPEKTVLNNVTANAIGGVGVFLITDTSRWTDNMKENGVYGAGSTSDPATEYNSGIMSQFVIDGPVTISNTTFFIKYEHPDGNGGYTASTDEQIDDLLNGKLKEGDIIQVFTGNLDNLTVNNVTIVTPGLYDGMVFDTSDLFTKGYLEIIWELMEDPNRVANTMITAGNTVLDFGRLSEAQATLRAKGTTRTWGSAIANFDSIDSNGSASGYDYNAWGGAVGVDHAFTDRTVVGVAMGRTYGENESEKGNEHYDGGSIDQDATMVGLYGTHKFKTKGIMNDVKFSAFAAYGWFENESDRKSVLYKAPATASWDSNAWVLSASLSRDITTDNDIVCSTYVGVEYTKATMDDFTEKGTYYNAAYTCEEDYSNLAVKVGMTVSKSFGGFTPYVGIAYIHDVKRDVPTVTAIGQREVIGEGCMPGRGAVQIKAGANWQLSETLDIFAGYSAEIRDNATEHNANLGMGLTF